MVNWSLLPDAQDEPTDDTTEPVVSEEASESAEAPNQWDEVTKRLAALEEANKRAEELGTDFRRSVGRVQSILDRMETATGKTRADLEASLDQKFSELAGLLEDVSGNIDPAILPDAVKEKVRSARQQAAQRSAAVNIDKLVEEKVAAMVPKPATNDIPAEWRLFERDMESSIKAAGLDPDNREMFDWNYAGYLLSQGRTAAAKAYFDSTIEANSTANEKLQAKKEANVESPTGAGAGAAKQWHEKLGDKNTSLEEKIKILKSQGALR